jgi:hypothetical protein
MKLSPSLLAESQSAYEELSEIFMARNISLQCVQQLTASPCTKPDESSVTLVSD